MEMLRPPMEHRGRAQRMGTELRPLTASLRTGLSLLFCTILFGPIHTSFLWTSGVGRGAYAELCEHQGEGTQTVYIAPGDDLNITSMFNCEEGDFDVFWNDTVSVPGTIYIGEYTRVRIRGNSALPSAEFAASTRGDSDTQQHCDQIDSVELTELTSCLALPDLLESAAVAVAPPNVTADTDRSQSFGPMFHVENGVLIIEDLIVRGGFAASTKSDVEFKRGAGVYARDSNVTITRCTFADNFAEVSGGGIFADDSKLVVSNSTFSGCRAGFQPVSGGPDDNGKGGAIHVSAGYRQGYDGIDCSHVSTYQTYPPGFHLALAIQHT